MGDEVYKGYTRVSKMLQVYSDYSYIKPGVLERKQVIGTNVHEAIANGNGENLRPRELAYYNSFRRWQVSVDFRPLHKEMRFFDASWRITGQVDAIGTLGNSNELILVDYKTASVPMPKVWILQAHFYHYLALKGGFETLSERVLFVQLSEIHTPKARVYKIEPRFMRLCESIVSLHHYFF